VTPEVNGDGGKADWPVDMTARGDY
jgi:hypothetical protein